MSAQTELGGMSKLTTHIKTPADLGADERAAWADLRAQNPALYSPYFHFEYASLLGKLRGNVHVLIVSRGADIIALLPFQAKINAGGKIGFANPVGSPMTDYHGFICAAGTKFDALAVLKQAGFGAFHFSALIDPQNMMADFARAQTPCTMMDVSKGADEWRAARDSSYRRHLKSNRRRIRKAEELGPRRFEFMSRDQAVFDQLIAWKKEKFAETGKFDVLSCGWTLELLKALWANKGKGSLRADMHALYFGDELAAIDFGLTDGTTFHSWMVAYDNGVHQLAPGIQLLEALIDEAADLGYARIDLGEGVDGYKRQYASEDISVSSGFVAASGPAAALSKVYAGLESFGEKKLGNFGKLPGKTRRRYTQISACEPKFSTRAKAMLAAVKGAP